MYIYVAKERPEEQNDVTEENPTYPPGVEEAPEFGFFNTNAYEYLTWDLADINEIHDILNQVPINTMLLHPDSAAATKWVNQASVPPFFYYGEQHCCVDASGNICGKPWKSQYYYLQEGTETPVLSQYAFWFRNRYNVDGEGDLQTTVQVYYAGAWAEAESTLESLFPTQEFVSTLDIAGVGVQYAAAAAQANGYIGICDEAGFNIAWPLTDFAFDEGFVAISRLGIYVKNPADHDELKIYFRSNTHLRLKFLYSNALPKTWGDVIGLDPITGILPYADGDYYYVPIPSELLTGTDPLYVWVLYYGDVEKNFTTEFQGTGEAGEFFLMDTQGTEEMMVNPAELYASWPIGRKTKLKLLGTDPTEYRELTVAR